MICFIMIDVCRKDSICFSNCQIKKFGKAVKCLHVGLVYHKIKESDN